MKKTLLVLSLSLLIVGAHQLYAWTEPLQGPLNTNVLAPLRYPLNSLIWGTNNQNNIGEDQGGNIELGGTNTIANPTSGGTPYIDFHFGTGAAQDYNTRIINSANNRLDFNIAGGVNVLRLDGSNVGIGGTPVYKLDVVGDINSTGYLRGNGKIAIQTTDTWLRLNPTGAFTSGIYAGTGILRTDGPLQVGASGASFVVAAGGNVGIAKTAPAYKLDVVGDANVTGCYRVNGVCLAPGGSGTVTGSGTGGYLPLWTGAGASTALGNSSLFESGGNVGLGTASPSWKLQVSNGDSSFAFFGPNTTWGGRLLVGAGQNQAAAQTAQVIATDGNLHLDPAPSKNLYIGYYQPRDVYINPSGGNVGIGTTAPADRLEINGSLRFTGANPAIYTGGSYVGIPSGLYVSGGPALYSAPIIYARGGIGNDTGANLVLSGGTSGASQFTGNVGIGTATPDQPLQVNGWIHATNIYAENGPGGSIVGATDGSSFANRNTGLYAGLYGVTSASTGYGVYAQNNMGGTLTAYALYCTSPTTGVACGGNHGWNQTSDARLKKDITPITNALTKIIKLQGVDFFWTRDKNNEKQNLGFIAQQVLPILPEAVGKDAEGYYSMDYSAVTPVLVEAVKELNTKIDKLQSENDDLRARLEKLEAKVK